MTTGKCFLPETQGNTLKSLSVSLPPKIRETRFGNTLISLSVSVFPEFPPLQGGSAARNTRLRSLPWGASRRPSVRRAGP